jgi:hypothetical protein
MPVLVCTIPGITELLFTESNNIFAPDLCVLDTLKAVLDILIGILSTCTDHECQNVSIEVAEYGRDPPSSITEAAQLGLRSEQPIHLHGLQSRMGQ